MKFMKTGKGNIFKILLLICSISLILFWVYTLMQSDVLKKDIEGLALVESINSGVQRISKLELENTSDDHLITTLDNSSYQLYPTTGPSEYFKNDLHTLEIIEIFINDWKDFKESVMNFRSTGDRDSLFLSSESNYNSSMLIVDDINSYIVDLTNFVSSLELYCIIHVVIIALLLVKILLDTATELKKNKELSKEMFIDTSTGLYNRSKCQEVLKTPLSSNNNTERSIVIFDLNDLKKTNDGLGHRAGDDLISNFAAQLKKATDVFSYDVFVGRYGGDEFMAYFSTCDQKDVEVYIKEVDYLMEKFNDTENKPFKLSCAAGYSITTPETKSMTMRELFDEADGDMYKNKLAMKEKKRQELLAQGLEETISKDDRL